MEQDVWLEIEQLYQKFQKLGISETVKKFRNGI